VPLTPSQTTRGKAWLTNFAATDRSSAALLLDSLQIVSPTDIHARIKAEINKLRPDLRNGTGILVPVQSIEDLRRSFNDHYRKQNEEYRRLSRARWILLSGQHTAWDTYVPGMPIPSTPGSEGIIGNIIRDLTGEVPGREPSHWLHPGTDLDALRDRRCRLLVLVTDYSGSGKQVIEFARTFVRNARIRSWRSFGWLKVVVVAYAVSLAARAAINGSDYVDDLAVAVPAASFEDAQWTSAERAAIERICRQYVRARWRKEALGFGDSGGLFMGHTFVPNNIPRILRQRMQGWSPFLDGRTVPPQLALELQDYRPPNRDLAAIARSVNQQRLARAIESGRLRTPADLLVAALSIIGYSTVDVGVIAHRLARSEDEVRAMLDFLVRAGLITADMSITPLGRIELRHARRLERIATANLLGSDEPYYPRALR
jgi:hypothetical protein